MASEKTDDLRLLGSPLVPPPQIVASMFFSIILTYPHEPYISLYTPRYDAEGCCQTLSLTKPDLPFPVIPPPNINLGPPLILDTFNLLNLISDNGEYLRLGGGGGV